MALRFALTEEQRALSEAILEDFRKGIDTLVYAVCGAGKTELTYETMAYAVGHGLKVGFALPRRDVVIELYWRLRESFPENDVKAVYGEHSFALEGDIVILTTHQLYRYPSYFDLLIMDEIDAFPFKGDALLEAMFRRALKGHCVMMSATPSKEILAAFAEPGHRILELRTRFHKQPIPVPEVIIRPRFLQPAFIIKRLRSYLSAKKPCLLFVPTIAESREIYALLAPFAPGGDYVSSKREGREEIIARFRKGGTRYLVTTSVLERGVTIKGLQVIVLHGDEDRIYGSATLIQIAGRVGRKSEEPDGEVLFLAEKRTKGMDEAIEEIRFCNAFL